MTALAGGALAGGGQTTGAPHPLEREVLWATSKVLATNQPANTPLDTDWTLSSEVPTEVVADGDHIYFPITFRGTLYLDVFDGDTLVFKENIEIEHGYDEQLPASIIARGPRPRTHLDAVTRNGESVYDFHIDNDHARNASVFNKNTYSFRVYSVSAIAGGSGITLGQLQQQLQRYVLASEWDDDRRETDGELLSLKNQVAENETGVDSNSADIVNLGKTLRNERVGVELIPQSRQVVFNLMDTDRANFTAEQAASNPTFSRVDILYEQATSNADVVYMGRYDKILFTVHLASELTGSPTLIKTQFFLDYNDWLTLKKIPTPAQGAYQDATIQDNRAISFAWEVDGVNRTIYIGRTNDPNSRLLYAITGWRSRVRMEARGYRGLK